MTPLALGAFAAALTLVAVPVVADQPRRPATAPGPSASGVDARGAGTSGEPLPGGTWPVLPPVVMTSFDDPPPYAPGHRGIDLSTSLGQVVVAAGDGTVTTAGAVAGRPIVVVAHSPTLRTTYLPVVPLVRLGDRVRAGEPIGVVSTPSHCPTTCLHWGARRGDRYIDPLSLLPLDAGPIVLLPLDP